MSHWEPVLDLETDCETLNLILSPGRVATTSMYLWCNRAGVKVFKTHTSIQKQAFYVFRKREKAGGKVPFFLTQARHVLGRAFKQADPVRIVIPTRDPLSRSLSSFRRFVATGRVTVPKGASGEALARLMEDEIPPDRLDFWLTRNLDPLWPGYDSGAPLLRADRPALRHDVGRLRFLVLRSEMPDPEIATALGDFFGQTIPVRAREETAESHNSRIPDDILQGLDALPELLSDSYRQALLGSAYARLFYPELDPRARPSDQQNGQNAVQSAGPNTGQYAGPQNDHLTEGLS